MILGKLRMFLSVYDPINNYFDKVTDRTKHPLEGLFILRRSAILLATPIAMKCLDH